MDTITTTTARLGSAPATPGSRTEVELRPRYEGSNICTWIGFKHVNYLIEEAVLDHLRRTGAPAGELFERHSLGVDIVDLDTRILHAIHVDDVVLAEVVPDTPAGESELRFAVTLHVQGDRPVKAAKALVRVVLRHDATTGEAEPAPESLRPFVTDLIDRPTATDGIESTVDVGGPILGQLVGDANAFAWKWRIPYFYCHFTERLQMSGYLRLMEEVVDLFLADRGISIKTLLNDQAWIPVVPHSRISIVREALMEEELYTVFTVEDVFKRLTYTARMDCYVVRDGRLLLTATGRTTHGYAVIGNRRDWSLVDFDDRMIAGLSGRPR